MTSSSEQPADRQPESDPESTLAGDAPEVSSPPAAAPKESTSIDTDNIDETMISSEAASDPEATIAQSGAIAAAQTSEEGQDFPSQFGRYRIEKKLGSGAMGAVYLAHDTQLNRAVALKVPTFGERSPGNMIERFYREARSAATLTHPNICPVYDVGEHEGTHFISMGYIEGRPLSDYIESGRKQAERQAAAVVRKLAMALQEAHDRNIIHRDLKPANVMIDRRSEPIVMDFGLARLTSDQEEAKLTREGTVMGSPAYMSPEQVEGSRDLGPACDIYSLGVVLYELLTGQTPYQGSVVSVIGQVLKAEPRSPAELRSDLSPEISAICLKAMARSSKDRFASMNEFAQALGAFIKGNSDAIETFVELGGTTADEFSLDELKAKKASATGMIKAKRFRDAVSTLEGLAELKGEHGEELAAWAKKQLPRAKEECDKVTEESKSLFRRAKKSMAAQDYERASQLLDQIPEDIRNNAVSDLHAEASDLADEVRQLSDDVEYAIQSGQNDGMLPIVERLLELKPQHRQANDLYNDLVNSSRSQKTLPRRSKSSGNRSRKSGTPIDPRLIGGSIVAVLLPGAVIYALSGGNDEQTTASDSTDGNTAIQTAVAEPGETTTVAASTPDRLEDPPNRKRDRQPPQPDDEVFAAFRGSDGRIITPDRVLQKLDSDGDGSLGRGEIGEALLARIDRNEDGSVDLAELRDAIQAFRDRPRPLDNPPGEFPRPFDGPPGNDRSAADRPEDRPGRPGKKPPEELFRIHDTNNDGYLDKSETPPFIPPEADLNEDGQITLRELKESLKAGRGEAFRPFRNRPGEPREQN